MIRSINAYCSWCYEKTNHTLIRNNKIQRNLYQCESCHNYTLKCRIPHCENMTKGEEYIRGNESNILKKIGSKWNNELCAEHDGSIASFKNLSLQLDELEEYPKIFKREKADVQKALKYTGLIVGGAVIFGLTAGSAAPGIAASLGSTGLLGTASTGTLISTLSGAALTNASLAAMGGGALSAGGFGMAGGIVFISAGGAALGGRQGGVISNNYFGSIKDFSIRKVRDGIGPALIFINGFLSQKNQDSSDWLKGVEERFPHNPCYYVTWESKANYDLGKLALKALNFKKLVKEIDSRATKKAASKLNPLRWASVVSEIISNPWHNSMFKASKTGLLLADLLPRVKKHDGFILMGHSLGCRVIYYLLSALSTKDKKYIKEVYLFGGAVAKTTKEDWEQAAKAVDGDIYNFYTSKDWVLKYLYKIANVWISDPIGLASIEYQCENIHNIDVSQTISGHMRYKNKLASLLE